MAAFTPDSACWAMHGAIFLGEKVTDMLLTSRTHYAEEGRRAAPSKQASARRVPVALTSDPPEARTPGGTFMIEGVEGPADPKILLYVSDRFAVVRKRSSFSPRAAEMTSL